MAGVGSVPSACFLCLGFPAACLLPSWQGLTVCKDKVSVIGAASRSSVIPVYKGMYNRFHILVHLILAKNETKNKRQNQTPKW